MKIRTPFIALAIVFLFSIQPLLAQIFTLEWAKGMGGPSTSENMGWSIAVDDSGNIYTTGYFEGTVDFDPGAETANLISAGDWDIYIQKLDASGNFLWAKRMGGNSYDSGLSIAVDGFQNVFTLGIFKGTVDFDPGSGSNNLISAGSNDIFVQKLDINGDFIWVKQIGGSNDDRGQSIAIDPSGNVYITGGFNGTSDFDPGEESANLTSAGDSDIFVQKLDVNGNFIWAKRMGGNGNDHGYSIAVDDQSNVYTTGYFEETADFNPEEGTTEFTAVGNRDVFVQKLDYNGNFLWVKQIGGPGDDVGGSLALDASGNVYSNGWFEGIAASAPEGAILNSNGGTDIFIQKLDSTGNLLWVKQMGGDSNDFGLSIAVDALQNIYTTGVFRGTVNFDPGEGTANITSIGEVDIFIQKLNMNGLFLSACQMGGTSAIFCYSLSVDSSGNLYTTGGFSEIVDFDPEGGTANLTSTGLYDIFVQKLSQSPTVGLNKLEKNVNMIVYPNPSSNIFNIEFEKSVETAEITVSDTQGKVIFITEIYNTTKTSIELNQPAGIYLLSIKSKEGQKTIQLIQK